MGGKGFDNCMVVQPCHNGIVVARQQSCDIFDRFSRADTHRFSVEADGMTAKLKYAEFKRDPRAERGFAENHGDGLVPDRPELFAAPVFTAVFLDVQ